MATNGTNDAAQIVWRDKRYTAIYLGIPKRKINAYLRDGMLFPNARKHPQTGAWAIPDDDVITAYDTLKTEHATAILASFDKTKRERPTVASCNRIMKRIDADDTLTDAQRDLFTARMTVYRAYFDTRYDARVAKRKRNHANKS